MYLTLFVGILCWSLFGVHYILSLLVKSEAILTERVELVALLLLSFSCPVAVNVLWLFLEVPWVCLQCMIMVFPDHTH